LGKARPDILEFGTQGSATAAKDLSIRGVAFNWNVILAGVVVIAIAATMKYKILKMKTLTLAVVAATLCTSTTLSKLEFTGAI
jgi:hypothetical protein